MLSYTGYISVLIVFGFIFLWHFRFWELVLVVSISILPPVVYCLPVRCQSLVGVSLLRRGVSVFEARVSVADCVSDVGDDGDPRVLAAWRLRVDCLYSVCVPYCEVCA